MDEVRQQRLDSGLACLIARVATPVVAVQLWIGAGFSSDPFHRSGMSHLVEHLMYRSLAEVEAWGGERSAWTGPDSTTFALQVPVDRLSDAVRLLGKTVSAPAFTAADLAAEYAVLRIEERGVSQDELDWGRVFEGMFAPHPYGRRPTDLSDLAPRRGAVLDAWATSYGTTSAALAVAGPVEEAAVVDAAQRAFEDRPGHAAEVLAPIVPRSAAVIDASGRVRIGLPAPAAGQLGWLERRFDLELLRQRRGELGATEVYAHAWRRAGALALVGEALAIDRAGELQERVVDVRTRVTADDRAEAGQRVRAEYWAERGDAAGWARAMGRRWALGSDEPVLPDQLEAGLAELGAPGRLAAASPTPTRASPTAPKRSRHRTRQARLPSGATLITEFDHSAPVVAIRITWPGGLALESSGEHGSQHLLAAGLTAGCGLLSARALSEKARAAGGAIRATVAPSSLSLEGEFFAGAWQTGLELMLSCATQPRFDHEVLEARRRRLMERARSERDDATVARSLALAGIFPDHGYGRGPASEAALSEISRPTITALHRQHYPASAMTIAVVGDAPAAEVRAFLDARLGAGPPSAALAPRPPAPSRAGQVFASGTGSLATLAIGFRGTSLRDPDRFALELAIEVLGSRLRDRLRGGGLAYRIEARSVDALAGGYALIEIDAPAEHLPAIVAGYEQELNELRTRAVPDGARRAAATRLANRYRRAQASRVARARALARAGAYGLPLDAVAEHPTRLEAVTASDLERVAAALLDPASATIATVVPPSWSPEAERRARGSRRKMRRRK